MKRLGYLRANKKEFIRLVWLFLAIAVLGSTINILSRFGGDATFYINSWLWLCFVALVYIAGLWSVKFLVGSVLSVGDWLHRKRDQHY